MGGVNAPTDSISTRLLWLGIGCCLLAAVGYTAANICLRQLAEIRIDPAWVICIKETVAVTLVGPWLLFQIVRRERVPLPGRALAVLTLVGLTTQLAGNVVLQWAFGVVGLAVSMPVVFGAMLIGSAVIGVVVFHELLPIRSFMAVAVVIGSVALLSIGAAGQEDNLATADVPSGVLAVLLGIGGAAMAGITYAGLGAAVRYAGNAGVTVTTTVVVVTGVGMVSLGVLSLTRLGPAEMLATPPHALAWMVASGLCNVIAFVFITIGLQLTTLVHANVLNASQVALGAAAGILVFQEPRNSWLLCGIAMTIAGMMLLGHPRRQIRK
jgi:drug/metabolite transporter (DMT)-like permease